MEHIITLGPFRTISLILLTTFLFNGCTVTFSKIGSIVDSKDEGSTVLTLPINFYLLKANDFLYIELNTGEIAQGEFIRLVKDEFLLITLTEANYQRGTFQREIELDKIERIVFKRTKKTWKTVGTLLGVIVDIILIRYIVRALTQSFPIVIGS